MITTDQFSHDILPTDYQPEVMPHRGYFIFGLGIASLWFPIFAPFAWVWGRRDLQAMRENRMDRDGWQMTDWGRLFGAVITCVFVGAIAVCLVLGVFAIFATPTQAVRQDTPVEIPQPRRIDLRPNPGQQATDRSRRPSRVGNPPRLQDQSESLRP